MPNRLSYFQLGLLLVSLTAKAKGQQDVDEIQFPKASNTSFPDYYNGDTLLVRYAGQIHGASLDLKCILRSKTDHDNNVFPDLLGNEEALTGTWLVYENAPWK